MNSQPTVSFKIVLNTVKQLSCTDQNDAEYWELHPEQEILADLQTVFDEGPNSSTDKK
ncbi:hypothetical protein QUF63_01010 [Anaerolineales bacterium HSG25]|nr:hypothetical protein [Anaerolineales bacterium HSG25]